MTAGLRWRTALVGAGLCCQAAAAAQWTLKTDFENGMRQGWESYPLAQDAGYDPTLDPAQNEGRRALERHKAPSRTGPFEIGFIRKVAAHAGSAPMLRFAYAVPYDDDGRSTRRSGVYGSSANRAACTGARCEVELGLFANCGTSFGYASKGCVDQCRAATR